MVATEKSTPPFKDPLPPDGKTGEMRVWTWICCSVVRICTSIRVHLQLGADAGREVALLRTTLEADPIVR